MNDRLWRDFLRILDTAQVGSEVTSNRLRDLMAASDIPEKSRGGLFAQAVNQGYLRPVGSRYEASNGATAHRAPVRIYKRTAKHLDQAVAA